MIKLGKVQDKLLRWLINQRTWKSIRIIKKDSNFRNSGNQIRSSLEGLVKRGLVLKEKGTNNYFEYMISAFGKQWINGYKYTLPILELLNKGPKRVSDIAKALDISIHLTNKNLSYLQDYGDLIFYYSGVAYGITNSGKKKLETVTIK